MWRHLRHQFGTGYLDATSNACKQVGSGGSIPVDGLQAQSIPTHDISTALWLLMFGVCGSSLRGFLLIIAASLAIALFALSAVNVIARLHKSAGCVCALLIRHTCASRSYNEAGEGKAWRGA